MALKKDGAPVLGAAVFHAKTNTIQYVNATGSAECNTVVRAELVAIHQALKTYRNQNKIHILTDSLTAIQQILLLHSRPHITARDHHYTLLTEIAHILEYTGSRKMPTTIQKVQAHSGIWGNEQADKAAKAVVDALTKQQHAQNKTTLDWILTTDVPMEPARQTYVLTDDPPCDELEGQPTQAKVFTTRADINRKVKPHYRKYTAPPSQYHRLMEQARTDEDPTDFSQVATYISTLVRKGARRQAKRILSFVWGAMYTQKHAYWFGHSKDQNCPLCKQVPDSCTHVGSGCYHPYMKALYLDRHAAAVRLIRHFIATSPVGASSLKGGLILVTEDSGIKPLPEDFIDTENLMQQQAHYLESMVPDPQPALIPPMWHLPTDHRAEDLSVDLKAYEEAVSWCQTSHSTTGKSHHSKEPEKNTVQVFRDLPLWVLPEEARTRLHQQHQGYRPDLVFVKGAPSPDPKEVTQENTEDWQVTLVEVGFCADLRLQHKKKEKKDKYRPLLKELQTRWAHVRLLVIPIGNTGTMLQSTKQELATLISTQPRKQLELKRTDQLSRTMVTMAAQRLYGITIEYYRQRRKMQQQEPGGNQLESPEHRKRPREDQEIGQRNPKTSKGHSLTPCQHKEKSIAISRQATRTKWKPHRKRPWTGTRKGRRRPGTAHNCTSHPIRTHRQLTPSEPPFSTKPPPDYHDN